LVGAADYLDLPAGVSPLSFADDAVWTVHPGPLLVAWWWWWCVSALSGGKPDVSGCCGFVGGPF
jgi:hypothetical protein